MEQNEYSLRLFYYVLYFSRVLLMTHPWKYGGMGEIFHASLLSPSSKKQFIGKREAKEDEGTLQQGNIHYVVV